MSDRPTLWVLTPDAVEHMQRRWPWLIRKASDADLLAALGGTYLPWCVEHESPQFARWDEKSKWLCQAAWWNDAGGACRFKPMRLVEADDE